jgi:hypothetical protein
MVAPQMLIVAQLPVNAKSKRPLGSIRLKKTEEKKSPLAQAIQVGHQLKVPVTKRPLYTRTTTEEQ